MTDLYIVNLYANDKAFVTYMVEATNVWHAMNKARKLHRELERGDVKRDEAMKVNEKVTVPA